MLIIDFETKSKCDLLRAGSYTYARHATTDILCCGFTIADPSDDREWLWFPDNADPLPADLVAEIKKADYIVAHNAGFDRLIWENVAVKKYFFPVIDFDRWYCSSAQMRVNNLPASLDDATTALNSSHRKDHKGTALIRLLSIPDPKTGEFKPLEDCEYFDALDSMGDYCIKDCRATKSLVNSTRLMTQKEHDDWLNNEDINDKGVLIDKPLAIAAQRYAGEEAQQLGRVLSESSGGVITALTQTVRAAKWIAEQLADDHPIIKMMTKYKDDLPKLSIDKQIREEILDHFDAYAFDLPQPVLDVINTLHDGSMSSVTKFKNMAGRADPETGRVYGSFIYAGASQTLRYTARGLQLHNFPSRDMFKTLDEAWAAYDLMMTGVPLDDTMTTLKRMLRHAVMPADDKWLVVGDWEAVEARILPWLSNSAGGDDKLDIIEDIDEAKNRGEKVKDLYERTADAAMLPTRTMGKICELALGFEGGVNAFNVFAKSYGIVAPEHEVKAIIKKWRSVNVWVVQFWHDLENAAIAAVRSPGTTCHAGRIRYLYAPKLIEGTLICILPDDSVLQYPKCRLEPNGRGRVQLTAMKASVKKKADATEWPRESLYGGRLAGNATQGTAAALLRDLISRLDDVVAHVHDEVILEVPEAMADTTAAQLRVEMERPPTWAEGLPLRAVPEILERYKK